MLVYDGGVILDPTAIRLPNDELASFRFVAVDELAGLLEERVVRRVRAALEALADGSTAELENGTRV